MRTLGKQNASSYPKFDLESRKESFLFTIMKVGDRIVQLRKQKGWSQAELAKITGASKEAIGKYERNDAMPSIETAKKIADAFDVTLDYLVDEASLPSFDKNTVKRLREIQLLGKQDQEHVYALLDAFITKTKLKGII